MNRSTSKVRTLTQMALLLAIVLVMAYTPLGYLPLGPLNTSLITIPVAIGAMTMGPVAGAVLGAAFGLTSFMNAVQGSSLMGVALLNASPVGYFIQAVIGRILCGLCAGLVYLGVKKALPGKTKLCCVIGAVSTPLLNTFFYMGFMMLLFYNVPYIRETADKLGASNPFTLVLAMVGAQGLFEAITCGIIATLVTVPLLRFLSKKQ